jgi:uncharacterized secreted protein with C-terminal beta-propeller domain
MSLFNLSNSAQILETIEDRENDLLTTQVYGLNALTRHIGINETVEERWKSMNFEELQNEKNKTSLIFNNVLSFAIDEKEALEIEIANLKTERSTWYSLIPPMYIFGFLVSQLAVLLHWKKTESKKRL